MRTPPHGLRVVHLSDRLVLHDITFALRSAHPSNRNALIDAANSVHMRHHSSRGSAASNVLIDVETSPKKQPQQHRYLVLPFATPQKPRQPPTPFDTNSPQTAGLPTSVDPSAIRVDAIAAFLGIIPLRSAVYAIFVTQTRHVANLPNGSVNAIAKVVLLPLLPSSTSPAASLSKEDKDTSSAIAKLLESGSVYYSVHSDISCTYGASTPSRKRPFQWNFPLVARLPTALHSWAPACIYGFVSAHHMAANNRTSNNTTTEFSMALISRRSRRRAGTRFITRGVDAMGDVANFVETEQLVWPTTTNTTLDQQQEIAKSSFPIASSFVIIRGSIPVFWRQNNGIARPAPELDSGLVASRHAFALHFNALRDTYSNVCAVSLIDKHGAEAVLAQAYDRHFDLYCRSSDVELPLPTLIAFDFHAYCGGKEYERGLSLLMKRLEVEVDKFGFHLFDTDGVSKIKHHEQTGVFRINCVDCLDRTNVVQTMICRKVLLKQLDAIITHMKYQQRTSTNKSTPSTTLSLFTDSEDRFKHIWVDHADAISKQYSGTGALKTDFTRTGKRSTTGVIGDGVKSVMRMYYKNFVDEGRQEVIDILCGNAVIRQQLSFVPSSSSSSSSSSNVNNETFSHHANNQNHLDIRQTTNTSTTSTTTTITSNPNKPSSSSLWYSFEAMRINAGGDKQAVFVELYDDVMYVTTVEGLCFEYPRHALQSWSKFENERTSNDKRAPSRLRLVYKPSYVTPATTSPLDLQFRFGVTARENFLRALLSWAKPQVTSFMSSNREIHVRVLVGLGEKPGQHSLSHWGLSSLSSPDSAEVIVLIIPEIKAECRQFGLAAAPVDVDNANVAVISAFAASERGPAIAVLASKNIAAPTVMAVEETSWKSPSSSSGSLSYNQNLGNVGVNSFSFGGLAAVSFEVCGTSLCFISARVSGMSQLSAALMELKLGRPNQDITAQFDHFVMAGLLGDVNWHHQQPNVKPEHGEERNNRTWTQIDTGSFCYSLKNGISVMRNSLPTLRYDDNLSSNSTWLNSSSSLTKMTTICVADGIIDGRSASQLPQNLCRAVVSVNELHAEHVKIPRGVESGGQMNCSVVLQSPLSTVDMVSSRPTLRATTFPEWSETLSLSMMPSDINDVFNSFLYGQIVVPNVLGDPFLVGSFVVALATARDGPIGFDVTCRLGGRATGRIVGRVSVDVNQKNTVNNDEMVDNIGIGGNQQNSSHPFPTRGLAAVNNNNNSSTNTSTSTDTNISRKSGSSISTSSVTNMLGGYAHSIRHAKVGPVVLDDMNDRLEAARKKGAKQMKSAFNKLSSLMSQPSSSGSNSNNNNMNRSGGMSTSSASNVSQFSTGNFSSNSVPSTSSTSSSSKPPLSLSKNDDRGFASSAVSKTRTMTKTNDVEMSADALLMGLTNSNDKQKKQGQGQDRKSDAVPLHVSAGSDDLLSGLAAQKMHISTSGNISKNGDDVNVNDDGDDDGWGEFESVGAPRV